MCRGSPRPAPRAPRARRGCRAAWSSRREPPAPRGPPPRRRAGCARAVRSMLTGAPAPGPQRRGTLARPPPRRSRSRCPGRPGTAGPAGCPARCRGRPRCSRRRSARPSTPPAGRPPPPPRDRLVAPAGLERVGRPERQAVEDDAGLLRRGGQRAREVEWRLDRAPLRAPLAAMALDAGGHLLVGAARQVATKTTVRPDSPARPSASVDLPLRAPPTRNASPIRRRALGLDAGPERDDGDAGLLVRDDAYLRPVVACARARSVSTSWGGPLATSRPPSMSRRRSAYWPACVRSCMALSTVEPVVDSQRGDELEHLLLRADVERARRLVEQEQARACATAWASTARWRSPPLSEPSRRSASWRCVEPGERRAGGARRRARPGSARNRGAASVRARRTRARSYRAG